MTAGRQMATNAITGRILAFAPRPMPNEERRLYQNSARAMCRRPGQPARRAEPDQPARRASPAEPAQPAQPVQPPPPDQPGQPDQPDQPARPARSARPAPPARPRPPLTKRLRPGHWLALDGLAAV